MTTSQRALSTAGRRPTIADVARLAQVSKTTVSRVLNGKPDVDSATIAAVRAVVDELGYVPSLHAVGLARGRAHSLGLLAPSLARPWMLEVMRGVTEAIENTDYSLTLYTTSQGRSSLDALHFQLRSQAIDGLAIMQPPEQMEDLDALFATGVPVVVIDDRGAHRDLPSVASTDEHGITEAVNHLAEQGRRRIAMIAGPQHIACHHDRLSAYRAALRAADLDLSAMDSLVYLAQDDTHQGGTAAAARLIDSGETFDAVVAGNDAMAIGAMRRLRASGRQIPQDVAVTGFDDVAAARYADPPLTTVYNPLYEMGGTAVRLLLEASNGRPLPQAPVLLDTHLVIRASTAPNTTPPGDDLIHWSAAAAV